MIITEDDCRCLFDVKSIMLKTFRDIVKFTSNMTNISSDEADEMLFMIRNGLSSALNLIEIVTFDPDLLERAIDTTATQVADATSNESFTNTNANKSTLIDDIPF